MFVSFSSIYFGISISVVSAVFTSSGICLQKLHSIRIKSVNKSQMNNNPSYSNDAIYYIGFLYVAVGLALKAITFTLLPQTIIAVLSAQNFIYTTLLEFSILGNKINKLTTSCLLIVSIGLIISVFGIGDIENEDYSFSDVWELFLTVQSITLTVSSIAFMIGMIELFRISVFEMNSHVRLFYISGVAGLFAAWFGTVTKGFFVVVHHNMFTSHHDKSFYWIFLLMGSIVLGIFKMKCVNSALKQFHHLQFLPLYQVNQLCYDFYSLFILY